MDANELAVKDREYRLERWKVGLSLLTPLVLVVLSYFINDYIKKLDFENDRVIQERAAELKAKEQTLAEKQRIYAELGRQLNVFYVYVVNVGDFRSYTPPRVVQMKREADRQFNMYLPYWSKATEDRYNEFMNSAFCTYIGAGLPAKINASKFEKVAAYTNDKLKWDSSWDRYFTEKIDLTISDKYYALVSSLLADTVNADIRKIPPKDSLNNLPNLHCLP